MAQPPQTTRRPAGAAFLAIPLLAVLVLAGVGAATSLVAGARAERVRGLVPFAGALTTLVHELQRERSLSTKPAASQEARAAGPALEAARRAVDGAVAVYRDAAVRLDISDRDRLLHQRLDAGLAELAGLAALRATVDGAPATGDPAAVSRAYTRMVANLLAVGDEIGLLEAGQDAGLLRAVTAASAFSRARELAEREREAAVETMAGGRFDPADRTQLATLVGRQDALLDQFAALASPGQWLGYGRAFPSAEVERHNRLRRAALDGGPRPGSGPDLASWAQATTARVERMGEVELGLTGEVARLAGLADRAADRRASAYGGVFLLTACAAAVLLVLAAGRARRTRARSGAHPASDHAHDPDAHDQGAHDWGAPNRASDPGAPDPGARPPRPPEGERSPARERGAPVVHTLPAPPRTEAAPGPPRTEALPAPPRNEAGPGLANLARRSQDLVDQQLELLEQVGRDQADPKLPGRLLQVDRLAARARRNAHNLIVLAGGQPGHDGDGPVPLADVAAAAVRGNPDAPRVDLAVPEDLVVPGPAADDLANLLAELVDNATAFSAPETRVQVSGQQVGAGYVLEVEDHGLGMTDGELDAVNRRLAGDPAAGEDLDQRLGAWVAGRLAERHHVRVQLRRSSYGGVTALVFFPEQLATAQPATPPVDHPGAAVRDDPPQSKPEGTDTALASLPLRRYVTQVPEGDQPLPKRAPHTSLAPDLAATGDPGRPGDPASRPGGRSPEQVRSMLTRYRSGLERGRAAAARDLPDDPDDDPA